MQFKTVKEMLEFVAAQHEAAVSLTPESVPVSVGDHVLRLENMGGNVLAIYGTITNPLDYWVEHPPQTAEDRAEMEYEVRADARDRQEGFTFGMWYSEMCPEGELGTAHRSTINMKISAEDFEVARSRGFPSDPAFISLLILRSAAGTA